MRTTRRQRIPILHWIVLGASVLGAIYAWVVFITTLSFQVFPTDKFMVSLVGSTAMALFWTTFILLRIIRSWPDRKATNRLCEQAIKLHRIVEHHNDLYGNPGRETVPGDTYPATLVGRLTGLRMAICVLNEWDPDTEAEPGGLADKAIQAYRENHDPAYAPDPW